MANKYLEKIAAFTGIEAAVIGAASANKGDRVGGAVSGIGGAIAGGTAANLAILSHKAKKTGMTLTQAASNYHPSKVSLRHNIGMNAGIAAGAYLGGKAYSKFKHRNDYNY